MKDVEAVATRAVDAAFHVHNRLGPGLFESVYEALLARELEARGLVVERQKVVPIEIDGIRFDEGFRLDLLVDGVIVLELKSVEKLLPVHSKQVLTYLRLLGLPLGFVINFGAPTFKEGIKRVANSYAHPDPSAFRAGASREDAKNARRET